MTVSKRAATSAALAVVLGLGALSPTLAQACACGCGVFDVGDGTLTPAMSPSGFTAWFRYGYMDQNRNWQGDASAPASDNTDKRIETHFFIVGGEYVINHRWTVMAELPLFDRSFHSLDDGTKFGPEGTPFTSRVTSLGDLQLTAMYTGLAPDMSTGLSLGVKLPIGDDVGPTGPLGGLTYDRDTLPGTGSTDLIFGAYHVGKVTGDGRLAWFVQARYQAAVATRDGYRPGNEFNSAVGLTYDLGRFGRISKVAPILQLINSQREHDTGPNSDPLNSGYERVLLSPGIEVRSGRVRLNADVALPVFQHVHSAASLDVADSAGQLVAPALVKVQLSYGF